MSGMDTESTVQCECIKASRWTSGWQVDDGDLAAAGCGGDVDVVFALSSHQLVPRRWDSVINAHTHLGQLSLASLQAEINMRQLRCRV